jgi:NADH pyrophosphatase NudC (nudix superfamily)
MHDELIDLVDKNGIIIASRKRSEVFAEKLKNFRLVCALVRNAEGKFFIPRRSATKRDYPNALACVGGCVQSGETYQQALKREVFEEIMLDIETVSHRFLGYISPFEHKVNGYIAAYEIVVSSNTITLNEQDFSEGVWLFPNQLKELIKNGEQATTNLKKIIEVFY